ncbi:trehalose-phosphatase [Sphingomonas sp. Root710]|uniref:trehalose-phosphatase n=1 Tax=Sphingomonas sp. Root710 TaxID=1736594 RepID=UPI001F486E14|nr:trehalose-phosphatase [Sphingomonas sp. Root710]
MLTDASLFLDFDGTLVDIAMRPEAVIVEPGLTALLRELARSFEGRLAIVSGRSLAQLDSLLGPIAGQIAISASHGIEHRTDGHLVQPDRPASLDVVAEAFHCAAASHAGALVEEKSLGVALHYRSAPGLRRLAPIIASGLATALGLTLQMGKSVVEVRAPGGNKGSAVRRYMDSGDMRGSRPIFIGDDLTDEAGFKAARELGGLGILVGGCRATAASFGLPHPLSVRRWLQCAPKAGRARHAGR